MTADRVNARNAAIVITMLVLAVYGYTLTFDLLWDDYVALRGRGLDQILRTWVEPWDHTGVWPPFYRPMSIALYSAAHAAFGHHGGWLHLVNLIELAAAAWLLRVFVIRETASETLGLIAAVLLIVHPETPSSLAAWISQQFHLAALISVLAAALLWQRVRSRHTAAWAPVLAALTIGALVKEDVLMAAPALVVWQTLRARIMKDVSRPSVSLLALFAVWGASYAVLRTWALGDIGGYGTPELRRLLMNTIAGPAHGFAMVWTPDARAISFVCGAGIAALLYTAWQRRATAAPSLRTLALYGVSLGLFANLPLILISGHTRIYLMILGAVLLMTGAIGMVFGNSAAALRRMPRAAAACVAVWSIAVLFANWRNTATFAPCAPLAIERNTEVLDWDMLGPLVHEEVEDILLNCRVRP